MTFITKRYLSRRTVLRGMGATLALPFLDSMVPALTAQAKTAAAVARRWGVFYVPNGMSMMYWQPKKEGVDFDLPRTLEPLTPYRDNLLVLSGLDDKCADPRPEDGGGDHARAAGTFLTGVNIKKAISNAESGVSADQIAARFLGKDTQLASLELAVESVEQLGSCDAGYSCSYTNTISWRDAKAPLPMENDPRVIFERLFGTADSTDTAARLAQIRRTSSVLDSVSSEMSRLRKDVGVGDRARLEEYVESVRDVERRLQKAEEQSDRELPVVEQPAGLPDNYAEHATLMFDLLALAYQTDLTRVSTFMLAKEVSSRAYPEIGVSDSHHPLSHHLNDLRNLDKLGQINRHHMEQFARFVGKLKSLPEGDGTVLDHSVLLYGAAISDSNTHFHDNLPIALVGGNGLFKGGRHVKCAKGTPVTNLFLTVLEKLGVPADKIGDSTGTLNLLDV